MEFIFWPMIIMLFVFVGIYSVDPKGWNSTFKRVSNMVRANIESGKAVKKLEPVKDMDDWDARFNGVTLAPVTEAKHEIVKKDYYKAFSGELWPQWHCKCGASGSEPVVSYDGFNGARLRAEKGSRQHIKDGNEREELMKRSGEKFQW